MARGASSAIRRFEGEQSRRDRVIDTKLTPFLERHPRFLEGYGPEKEGAGQRDAIAAGVHRRRKVELVLPEKSLPLGSNDPNGVEMPPDWLQEFCKNYGKNKTEIIKLLKDDQFAAWEFVHRNRDFETMPGFEEMRDAAEETIIRDLKTSSETRKSLLGELQGNGDSFLAGMVRRDEAINVANGVTPKGRRR